MIKERKEKKNEDRREKKKKKRRKLRVEGEGRIKVHENQSGELIR